MNRKRTAQQKKPRWRVSYEIQIPNGTQEEFHETYPTKGEARRGYKGRVLSLYRTHNHLSWWRCCLNRLSEAEWENPLYQEEKCPQPIIPDPNV